MNWLPIRRRATDKAPVARRLFCWLLKHEGAIGSFRLPRSREERPAPLPAVSYDE